MQCMRIDAESLQDRWCNFGSDHRGFYNTLGKARIRDNQTDIGITETETTVLSILLARSRVDSAVLRLHDDVRRTAVGRWIIELELQFVTCQHLVDKQCFGVGV